MSTSAAYAPAGVELRPQPALAAGSPGSVCAVVGSFDPLHRGHMWMVQRLLARFDLVALLVPARHFTKAVCPPHNATLDQRLDMIQRVYPPASRVLCGVAHEVLFVRLAACLERRFPGARVTFAMGNDTFELLADSASYFNRLGLPWGDRERRRLARLAEQVVVFGRSARGARYERVPDDLRAVSSTRVRRAAVSSKCELSALVHPLVLSFIHQHGLYREPMPNSWFLVPGS